MQGPGPSDKVWILLEVGQAAPVGLEGAQCSGVEVWLVLLNCCGHGAATKVAGAQHIIAVTALEAARWPVDAKTGGLRFSTCAMDS